MQLIQNYLVYHKCCKQYSLKFLVLPNANYYSQTATVTTVAEANQTVANQWISDSLMNPPISIL